MPRKNFSLNNLLFLSIIGITLLSTILTPFSIAAGVDQNTIDEFVNTEKSKGLIPGFAVSVIANDSIYTKGYGKGAKNIDLTGQIPMAIGGISKSITAIAIMQLNESGLLDLDAEIPKYIPWFEMKSDQAQNITIRELLRHTSGISGSIDTSSLTPASSIEDAIKKLKNEELVSSPRSAIVSSNVNYQILGLLIEKISNQSYEQFIQEHIFSPLEMHNSYANFSKAMENGASHGYNVVFGFPIESKNDIIANYDIPSNGLCISAEDMAILLKTLMNNGSYSETEHILKPSSIQEMFSVPIGEENITTYSAGWSNSHYLGYNIIASFGDLKDFHAEIIMIPEENISVMVFINTNSLLGNKGYYSNLGTNLLNLVLGNSVKSKLIGYNILYIIINILIIITLSREALRYIYLKKHFSKSVKGIIDPLEKRRILISKIVAEFVMSLLIIFLLPFLLSLGLQVSGLNIFNLIKLQPDIAWWLIFFGASYTVQGILKFVLYKRKIVK